MARDNLDTYYNMTLQEAKEGVVRLTYETEQQLKKLADIQREIAEVERSDARKRCPICGGRMRNIERLSVIGHELFWTGSRHYITLEHHREGYGMRVPETWECQDCHTFPTDPPSEALAQFWTPEDISERSKSLAAIIFNNFPQVDEVALESRSGSSSQYGWLLKVKEEWYFYEGPKQQVLERLGID